jgi:hypothetical protein
LSYWKIAKRVFGRTDPEKRKTTVDQVKIVINRVHQLIEQAEKGKWPPIIKSFTPADPKRNS